MEIYKATGDSPGKLMFTAPDSGGGYEEVIRIEHGKFYWKGEEVEDAHNVYERFNNWLKIVEANTTSYRDEIIDKLREFDGDMSGTDIEIYRDELIEELSK